MNLEQAMLEADGYVEVETDEDGDFFGYAADFRQSVLDHIKDKAQRIADEGIPMPVMRVVPFYLAPPPDDRDKRIAELEHRLALAVEALETVQKLDYFQEHNWLARHVADAIAQSKDQK